MCTIIVAVQAWAGHPLVVVANRDERLDRPSEGFAARTLGARRALTPLDLVAGGTWLGVNDAGLFVGVTNRFSGSPDPSRRSRGLLVHEALEASGAGAAADGAARHDAQAHNPFHLVLADREGAHVVWNDGARVQRRRLEPGLFVITERSLGAAPTARPAAIERAMQPLLDRPAPELAALVDVLRIQAPEPRGMGSLEGVWVQVPEMNYGTRSSTLVALGDEPTLWHAEGPPPATPFQDHSGELRDLLAGP